MGKFLTLNREEKTAEQLVFLRACVHTIFGIKNWSKLLFFWLSFEFLWNNHAMNHVTSKINMPKTEIENAS